MRPAWRIVALRSVPWCGVSGADRDVTLSLPYRPRRASRRRLANLVAYAEKHPTGWKRRFELARHLVEEGRLDEAVHHFAHVIRRQPRHLPASLEMGSVLEILGRTAEATAIYENAMTTAPAPAVRWHLEALAAGCRRRWEEARSALERALAESPRDPHHLVVLGRTCLRAGRPLAAMEALDRALELDPEDAVALTCSHRALLATGHPVAAARRIERAVDIDATNPIAVGGLVGLRITAGQLAGERGQRTRYLLRRLAQMAPNRAETLRLRAAHRLARGAGDEARAILTDFLDRRPRHARAWLGYGRVLLDLGMAALAGEAAARALELDPQDSTIARQALPLLVAARCHDLPSRAEAVLSRFPGDRSVLSAVAAVLRSLVPDRSLELARRAVDLESGLPAVWFAYGRVLDHSGRTLDAIEAYEEGWKRLPANDGFTDSAPAALALADLTSRCRELERSRQWVTAALEHADRARVIDPGRALAWRNLALTHRGYCSHGLAGGREIELRPALYCSRR